LDTDLFPDIIAPSNYNTCGSYFVSILHSSLQYREIKIKKITNVLDLDFEILL
jgi:hypothetical protein